MTTVSHDTPDEQNHGHHDPNLAHHFDSLAQQFDSAKLGIWLFRATEVLFFGGLFVAYAVLRTRFPEVFSYASHYLNTLMGGINTCVLILSSLTMAMAVRFAQTNRKNAMLVCLVMLLQSFALGMLGAIGIAIVAALLVYEHSLVKADDLSRVNAAFFTVNGYVSVLFFVFWAADVWYARRGV